MLHLVQQKKSSPAVGLSGLCYEILDIAPPSLVGSLHGAREPYLAQQIKREMRAHREEC